MTSTLMKLQEQLDVERTRSPTIADMEVEQKVSDMREQIQSLSIQNAQLQTDLKDSRGELDSVMQSKVLQYDHECNYKEEAVCNREKLQCLEKDYDKALQDLATQGDEMTLLSEKLELRARKLDVSVAVGDGQLGDVEALRVELGELRAENERLNDKLFEAIDEGDKVRRHNESKRRSMSNAPSVSLMQKAMADDYSQDLDKEELLEKIKHLESLNQKLSDMKLTNCTKCDHLKQINQSFTALKLENKNLQRKIKDSERRLNRADLSSSRIGEDLNASNFDVTLNESAMDGVNVTLLEDKVQHMQSEIQDLKEDHRETSKSYQENGDKLDKIEESSRVPGSAEKPKSRRARYASLENDFVKLRSDINALKERNHEVRSELQRYINEKETLLATVEQLKSTNCQLEEKICLLECDLQASSDTLDKVNAEANQLRHDKINVEVVAEGLSKQKQEFEGAMAVLQREIDESREINGELQRELAEKAKSCNQLVEECNRLKSQVLPDNKMAELEDLEKESEAARSRILKECNSLKPEAATRNATLKLDELFDEFLATLMKKEQEIMQNLADQNERRLKRLSESIKQSEDNEKRAESWAKELEGEVDRLQTDLTSKEGKLQKLKEQIQEMEASMKEKALKIDLLEGECRGLQSELEEKSIATIEKEEKIGMFKEREKCERDKIQRLRDKEWEVKLLEQAEKHKEAIRESTNALESYKSKNAELLKRLEKLEANERHLRQEIEAKSGELAKSVQSVKRSEVEYDKLMEAYNQSLQSNAEKEQKVVEITGLLKSKCDELSECRTKLSNVEPEHRNLKKQLDEWIAILDKNKDEIAALKAKNDELSDKLDAEERTTKELGGKLTEAEDRQNALKNEMDSIAAKCNEYSRDSSKLKHVLVELSDVKGELQKGKRDIDLATSRHETLQQELDSLQETYDELKKENDSLRRKSRNSGGRVKIERDLEDLRDKYESSQKSLEGATNLISELKEAKTQLQMEIKSLKAQPPSAGVAESPPDMNVAELKVQLEAKAKEIEELNEKVKELDEECEELAQKVQSMDSENAKVSNKVYDLQDELEESQEKMRTLTSEIESLRKSASKKQNESDDYKKLVCSVEEARRSCETLKQENATLLVKIRDLEGRHEAASLSGDSRSSSPALERRRKRSDLFNRNR